MFVILVLLSQATREEGRQMGGDSFSLHSWRRAPGVEELEVVVLKRLYHLLKEGDIAARAGQWLWASWRWPKTGPLMPQLGGT